MELTKERLKALREYSDKGSGYLKRYSNEEVRNLLDTIAALDAPSETGKPAGKRDSNG